MKIQPHKFLGLIFNADMQTQIYSMQNKKIEMHPIESEKDIFRKEVYDLLITEGNRNYIMTKPSIEISEKIKIDEKKFDGTIYKGLKLGKKISILINDRLFFRYYVTQRGILCMWVLTEPIQIEGRTETYMRYTTFRIDTETGLISLPDRDKEETRRLFKQFLQLITFLEFSDLETVTLKPNAKMGTKREGKYVNESKLDVTIVDSTWNKTIVRVGEFGVSGHLRLQPVGLGRNDRKLIYISEYHKKGYVRKAKSTNDKNENQNE